MGISTEEREELLNYDFGDPSYQNSLSKPAARIMKKWRERQLRKEARLYRSISPSRIARLIWAALLLLLIAAICRGVFE